MRNLENISWKDHKTNEYDLDIVIEKGKIFKHCTKVLESKKRWLGYVLRRESLVKEVIEGLTEEKRGIEKRIMLLDDIKTDETYEMIKRRALTRKSWGNWVPRT